MLIDKKMRDTLLTVLGVVLVWSFFGDRIMSAFRGQQPVIDNRGAITRLWHWLVGRPQTFGGGTAGSSGAGGTWGGNFAPATPAPTPAPTTPTPTPRRGIIPSIPKIPSSLGGSLRFDDILPWERNRQRREVLYALVSDMQRVHSLPFDEAARMPEVTAVGGVHSYLNLQKARFTRALTTAGMVVGSQTDRPQTVQEIIGVEDKE